MSNLPIDLVAGQIHTLRVAERVANRTQLPISREDAATERRYVAGMLGVGTANVEQAIAEFQAQAEYAAWLASESWKWE